MPSEVIDHIFNSDTMAGDSYMAAIWPAGGHHAVDRAHMMDT